MSKKSEARRSVVAANNHLGGAFCTKKQRRSHGNNFIDWCYKNAMPLMSIKEATFEPIKAYLAARGLPPDSQENRTEFESEFFKLHNKKPCSIATIHNILASLRRTMKALKTDPDSLGITAQNLGLASKCRRGKKLPITDEIFFAAVAAAISIGEIGFSISLRIERFFGHRGLEALMSGSELKKYALEAIAIIDGKLEPLVVRDGTKGGRLRQTIPVEKYAKECLETIADALTYLVTHKFLVEGKKPGLKAGRAKYQALARKVGLIGKYSPHSCRYAYATDKLVELRDAGIDRKTAMGLCAEYLGHGATRTQFVSNVYGQTVVATFPKTRRRRSYAAAAAEVSALLDQVFPASAATSDSSFGKGTAEPD